MYTHKQCYGWKRAYNNIIHNTNCYKYRSQIKYPRISLTKGVKDIYYNYKTSGKEIEEDTHKKRKKSSMLLDWKKEHNQNVHSTPKFIDSMQPNRNLKTLF